jgi:hypothetical protein
MSNPCGGVRCTADLTSSEMQWLDPLGRDADGNKTFAAAFRGRGHQIPLYICRSCCIILRAADAPDTFYIARAVKLYERSSDGAKMVSCQWFYRAQDTILAHRKGSANRVGKQELFESDSVDENSLHSVEDICEVFAEPLLDDVHTWLSSAGANSDRYFYGSKYIPILKNFRALSFEDLRIARLSFAASTRAAEQTAALRMIGQLIRATLLPAPNSEPSSVRVSLRLHRDSDGCKDVEKILLKNKIFLGSEWKRVLNSEAYGLIASRNLVTSNRVGCFEDGSMQSTFGLHKHNQGTAAERQHPAQIPNCIEIFRSEHKNPNSTADASKENATGISILQDLNTINRRSHSISETIKMYNDTAVDVQNPIESGATVSVFSDVSSEGVSSEDVAAVDAEDVAAVDAAVEESCSSDCSCGCQSSHTTIKEVKSENSAAAEPVVVQETSFSELKPAGDLKTGSCSQVCDSSDLVLTCKTEDILSYASPTHHVGNNKHYTVQAHPPARSKYKAPLLQLHDSTDPVARRARKRAEPCSNRESRRGLQVEFSDVTVNHLMSKRLRKFDDQHSR